MNKRNHKEKVWASYNERWKNWINVYEEIVNKIADPTYVVRNEAVINQVHRFVIAYEYIKNNHKKGAKIIDAACGIGFNTCYLNKQGYNTIGFDFSPIAIERARELEISLGLKSTAFVNKDHSYLSDVSDESIDVVLAMGYLRYVNDETRDFIYRNVARILKKGGNFIISNTNQLFAMFALNDETLKFWSEIIEDFSSVKELFAPSSILQAMCSRVKVPKREYAEHSVSKQIVTHEENPLEYGKVVSKYGFKIHKIFYPDSHLLPPFLEQSIGREALENIKAKICLSRAEDWRSMFMCYEFLSILVKE